MLPEKIIAYFLPLKLQNKLHPKYDEVCVILSGMLVAAVLLIVLPLPLLYFSVLPAYFIIIGISAFITCYAIKVNIDYRIPTYITFTICFAVYIHICDSSGNILSPYMSAFYGILLTGSWAGKQFGYFTLAGCITSFAILAFLQYQSSAEDHIYSIFFFHCCLTIFMLIFFNMLKAQNEYARQQVRKEQHLRINELNTAIRERNQQINNMRQMLASDFHDETGNILSAITRQAIQLKNKVDDQHETMPIIENIIINSEHLYESSRDFLWGINHQNDEPEVLFGYLTSFGQFFYNQFDTAFSVQQKQNLVENIGLLAPFASRHIILIFKEAMNNVIKHANANEVILAMEKKDNEVTFTLIDDGKWKKPSVNEPHNGLANMKKRSSDNGFELEVAGNANGTKIILTCPLIYPI
ncbi:MAG: hypothetical protein REI64_11300 [Pedobacter sp.]|uniref:sensor histidine kinase n=1 Tax=Pedobacter sp. TaxID=1411316 RepID=UPI002809157F|nr:ATP-binding protein [Pedobacter sp.]MDQ8005376.1 hypothetical protein [Pedobacter sp.]